ncbi:3-dehydroquinate synthase [Salsuginibacillus kocurii]|uniref:3-dehydroquinate synthase n=1 Tax=Salsuginibacillus kocurii TaxID=427078 RepID=UPI00037B8D5A|nr:3-dehydroquinate synthase [Salsuginibacillus kocurii]
MESLRINASTHDYTISIGPRLRFHLVDQLPQDLWEDVSSVLVLTDEAIAPLYLEDLVSGLANSKPIHTLTLPQGEHIKSMEWYERVLTVCLEKNLDRHSLIMALGGGVIGDLAGFSAATYMRGINYIQVPTTLLAQDSSVGGKTGINHELGKNMIGSFHQPAAVVYDTEMLTTLPEKEWRSGFAEMIKHAFIHDEELLTQLKEEVDHPENLGEMKIEPLLKRSIQVKADIVQKDEKEQGVRAYLNFGHTLGHALEKHAGYGELTHGEGVACGMIFALQLSEQLGYHVPSAKEEAKWFEKLGYDLSWPAKFDPEALVATMKKDKKARNENIQMVLLKTCGRPTLTQVDEKLIVDCLNSWRERL